MYVCSMIQTGGGARQGGAIRPLEPVIGRMLLILYVPMIFQEGYLRYTYYDPTTHTVLGLYVMYVQ